MGKFSTMKHLYFCNFTTLFIVFLLNIPSLATPSYQDLLSPGSSISVEDNSNMLVSSNLLFSCGFYKVGVNAFTFAVWVNQSIDQAVVWTANQDLPVNGRGSRIELWRDGTMALLDFNRKFVWSTGIASPGVRGAQLLDTGNLVLLGPDGNFLWQSFDWPTDTLLPTQPFTANTRLGSGNYMLSFHSGNGIALTYNTPEGRIKYWPKNTSRTQLSGGQPRALTMLGCFSASDQVEYCASDKGAAILRRLTLGYDGNLRIYSLSESTGRWSISWIALAGACEVHGLCGNNGMCGYAPNPTCTCPPGFVSADPSDWTKGCTPIFDLSCDKVAQMHFVNIGHMSFWGYPSNYTMPIALDDCMKSCSDDLHCEAFAYRVDLGACKLKGSVYSGGFAPSEFSLTFLKLPADAAVQYGVGHQPCNLRLSWQHVFSYPPEPAKGFQWNYLYMPVGSVFAVEAILLPIAWCFLVKMKRESSSRDDGFALVNGHFRKFTFKELVRATGKFKDEIGRGGSGVVHKGILDDGKKIAVKKLQDMVQGELEFQSELSVIGKIYHMNLVRMWGFCSERAHKLLVFEYVENGSLAKLLFDGASHGSSLMWKQRYRIAAGVAKALAYLHHECLEWVIHCDVKPENILLDEDFEPKLADFGLVKLLNRGKGGQMLSRVQGTRGYIAPEWASNLPITAKVDVYGYGVVLLELVRGLRVSDWTVDGEEEVEMVFRSTVALLRDKSRRKEYSWLPDFVDSKLQGDFCRLQAATMVELAIACVEEERSRRPNMKHVVEKLLSCDDENPYVMHLP